MKKKLDLEPLNGYVFVVVPKLAEETKSGIIKSESMKDTEKQEGQNLFEVLAVGPDVPRVEEGDKVMMNVMQLSSIEHEGYTFGMIGKGHLIAVQKKK